MPYKNPEDRKRNKAEYRKSGRAQEVARNWRAKNKDKVKESKHREFLRMMADPKKKALHVKSQMEIRKRVRIEVLNRYGGECACCRESRYEFLSFDHINQDGNIERKSLRGSRFLTSLRNGPVREDIQILCFNCNMSWGFYGYCPHLHELGRSFAKATA